MDTDWMTGGLVIAAIATGLVAGVFLSFSDFVMRSLAAAEDVAGIEAMQMINRIVYRSIFMVLLMGMVPVSAAISALGLWLAPGAAAKWMIVGGVVYVLGVFLVTAICNVPMNKRLDGLAHRGAEAAGYWPDYVRNWSLWNHVRTASSVIASAAFLMAALDLARGI